MHYFDAEVIAAASLIMCTLQVQAADGYRLENDYAAISFNSLGRVTGMLNKQTGAEYLRPDHVPGSPFEIDAYPAHQSFFINDYQESQSGGFSKADPRKLAEKPGDLVHLRPGPDNLPEVDESEGTIRFTYGLDHGITVAYSVELPPGDPVSRWQIAVTNGLPELPRDQLRVYRTAFPLLPGLCVAGTPEGNYLARPFAQGELIPNPSRHSFCFPDTTDPATHVLTYPGWASMPWMDLYGSPEAEPDVVSGLYLASYDPTFQQIDLEAFPDPAQGTVTLDVRTYAYLEPEQEWTSQSFMVGMHRGDWHWAGDRYRADSAAWFKPRDVPAWVSQCDGWYGTGGPNYRYSDLPGMLEMAQWLGLDYLQVWSQMLENVGPDKTRKQYYCFFLPDPDRGGEAELTEAVKRVRAAGGHIGFYSNLWTFDATLPRGLEQWKDAIPAGVSVPDWNREFKKYASVFPDGHIEPGAYPPDGYAGMCPGAEGYRDYLYFWIVDKYVRQYGVDCWYIDSCPVTMFGAARTCFSLDHGESHPHGVGRGIIELVRRLREGGRETADLAISMETVSDVLMQYASHGLGLELVNGLMDYPRPEIYNFTFPHHPIFSGTCNSWTGIAKYYDDMEVPLQQDAMNRVFLIGNRFDVLGYPLNKESEYWLYMRDLIALRKRIKDDLYASSFRDEIGLGPLPRGVEAKIFRHDEGKSLTLTLLDRRPEKAAFDLDLDPVALDIAPPSNATLYTLDGRETPFVPQPGDNGRFTLTIPARQANPAAVVLRR
jgi:hypothetical protein